jgi:hypothetical protein
MAYLVVIFVAVNGLLLSTYLESDRNVGGTALVLFNVPVLLLAVSVYVIMKITSDR